MVPFNFSLGVRNIWKNKVFSLINISGLALTMAACLTLALFLRNEWNHDSFHENIDSIYRITGLLEKESKIYRTASTEIVAGELVQNAQPDLINMVRFAQLTEIVRSGNRNFEENQILFTDNAVFTVFNFPLLKGDPHKALLSSKDVVITEAMADKYFGSQWRDDESIVNRSFKLLNHGEFRLAGIAKNLPANSSIRFDFLLPFSSMSADNKDPINREPKFVHTYVQLAKGTDTKSLGNKLKDIWKPPPGYTKLDIELQPLREQYLQSSFDLHTDWGKRSDISYVRLFSAAGTVLLIIALVNFINLTTARSLKRALEVGMRRLTGASRAELAIQFLGESMIVSIIAGVVALIFVTASQEWLAGFTGNVFYDCLSSLPILVLYFSFILFIGLIAGLYPAFILSAFSPANIIRKKWSNQSGKVFRQILVVCQFAISVTLITCTFFVYRQINFIRHKDLGFHKEQLMNLRLAGKLKYNSTVLREELEKLPGVIRTAASTISLLEDTNAGFIHWTESKSAMKISAIYANTDHDFIPVLGLELLAGSNFPKQLNDDTAAFIINVSAVEAMGETISGVIGKPILCNEMPGLVTGVVKNFHFKPLKSGIEPFICGYQPKSGYSNMFVKTHEGDSEKLIRQMENVYNQFEPDIPFRFTILRDALEKSYTEEKRIASVIMFFAVLTIFIGCFGLCGLTLYSSERRIKEIGIRKVLGAGITSIATTLTKDFMLLVSLGILIAIPVAWMLINSWLKQYAYRTEIEWWVFVIVAMMVLLIACITVGLQSLATAKMNPIRVLRCE